MECRTCGKEFEGGSLALLEHLSEDCGGDSPRLCPHCGEDPDFCSYADEPDRRRRPSGCLVEVEDVEDV